jgi:hypothetical protein
MGPATLLFAALRAVAQPLVAGVALFVTILYSCLATAFLVLLTIGVLGPVASWMPGAAVRLPRGWFNGFFAKLVALLMVIALPKLLGPKFEFCGWKHVWWPLPDGR